MDSWSAAVQDVGERAKAAASEIEAAGRLPDDLLDRALELGLFKMTMPTSWNGPGLTPARAYEVGRDLARADGSLGWLTMVSTAWFGIMAATADPAFVLDVLADDRAMMAGGVAGSGTATPTDGGFAVEGRWSICSGAWFATWLGGLCLVDSAQPPKASIVSCPQLAPPSNALGTLRACGAPGATPSCYPASMCLQLGRLGFPTRQIGRR